MGCADVCIEFKLLKVKVPMIFLGTVGFSLRREGRYFSNSAASAAPKQPASPKAISSNKSTPTYNYQIDLYESIYNLDTVCHLPRRSATSKSRQ
jgi:hypothetical protein